jgi:hypothetical protein
MRLARQVRLALACVRVADQIAAALRSAGTATGARRVGAGPTTAGIGACAISAASSTGSAAGGDEKNERNDDDVGAMHGLSIVSATRPGCAKIVL